MGPLGDLKNTKADLYGFISLYREVLGAGNVFQLFFFISLPLRPGSEKTFVRRQVRWVVEPSPSRSATFFLYTETGGW